PQTGPAQNSSTPSGEIGAQSARDRSGSLISFSRIKASDAAKDGLALIKTASAGVGNAMIMIVRIAALLAALFAGSASAADTYPNRLVRIIVPFPAGGPTDVMARLIGQKLSERLGQQFIVENMPGAAGNIGMGNAARAAGDGYTILFVSS